MLFFVPFFFFQVLNSVEVKRVLDAAPDVFATLGLSPEDPGWLVGTVGLLVGDRGIVFFGKDMHCEHTHTCVTCLDK